MAGIAVDSRSEAQVWIKMRAEMAMALTAALDTLEWPEQRLLVRDACWFPDTSLFNALSVRSLDVAPDDPPRALQLSLLAIDSLASNRLLGIDPGLAALGWTRVARSQWRAGSVASLGAEASAALKSGLLDAAAVVLSRWNVDARARRALRFVDVQG